MIHKFRAWDKKNKCYIPEWQDATRLIEKHGFNGGDQFIVEQSVGLKDKNGRLIYKGDIVVLNVEFTDEHNQVFVLNDYTGLAKTLPSMGAVIKCSFYIDVNSLEEFKYENYKNIVGYRSEIIGTVNENPELLNETKGNDNEDRQDITSSL